MMTVTESIHVDASPDRVFEFLDDPTNHRDVTPSLEEIRSVEPLDNGGKRLEHTYRMAGVAVDGELIQTVHDPPERHTFDLRGGIDGEIDIEIVPAAGGAEVTYAASYELPDSVVVSVAEPLVRQFNQRQLRRTLENLDAALAAGE